MYMLSGDILIFISLGYSIINVSAICSGDHFILKRPSTYSLSLLCFLILRFPYLRFFAFLLERLSALPARYCHLFPLPLLISLVIVLLARFNSSAIFPAVSPQAKHLLISSRSS